MPPSADVLPSRLSAPLYFLAALMVGVPALDFVTNVWPPQFGNVEWRYGMGGLLSGFTLTPLFGAALATGVAGLQGHRGVLRVTALLYLAAALLLLVVAAFFVLDVLQLRGSVPAEARRVYDVGAVKSVIKHGLAVVAFAWLGHAAWRVGRRPVR